jgi:energy-coupling factor transport system ATP-binding protein
VEDFCQKIGVVFQDIDSQMVASVVEDEILFGLENFGVPHPEVGIRLNKVLRELGIEELRTREIASLSGGQKQKVAIASILALEPEIMILDEPTGELDPESSQEIFGLLKKLNVEKGITIIIVEQKIKLLCEYVQHLVVLDKGVLQFDGVPREVVTNIDAFKQLGINVPPVAELAGRLRTDGLYDGAITLNVEEAESMVRKVLRT